jgi:hypothetical protein
VRAEHASPVAVDRPHVDCHGCAVGGSHDARHGITCSQHTGTHHLHKDRWVSCQKTPKFQSLQCWACPGRAVLTPCDHDGVGITAGP